MSAKEAEEKKLLQQIVSTLFAASKPYLQGRAVGSQLWVTALPKYVETSEDEMMTCTAYVIAEWFPGEFS